MKRRLMAVVAATMGVAILAAAPQVSANPPAASKLPSEADARRDAVGGVAPAAGLNKKFSFSKLEVKAARAKARAERAAAKKEGRPERRAAFKAELRKKLAAKTAADGAPVDESTIDVAEFLGGDVALVVPPSIETDRLDVTIHANGVNVEVVSSEGPGAPAGPGMSPYWSTHASGKYMIRVEHWGEAFFEWRREKLRNDGSTGYDWYGYLRYAKGDPYEVYGFDAKVKTLQVQNWPYDSFRNGAIGWEHRSRSSTFTSDCVGVMTVSIAYKALGASKEIVDCDTNHVWFSYYNEGSYRHILDQGSTIYGGDREAAYAWVVRVKAGTPGSQHDAQRVEFFKQYTFSPSGLVDCGVFVDRGGVCYP